jgi:uncharacterized hydrophobic protein (TIGR00271 family)
MGLGELIHGGPVTEEEVARVRDTVAFEPPDLKVRLVRFWILLTLAAAISTYGLLADSVATVIGAMIVAPLMLPIMGLAFGISIGDRRAIVNCLLVGIGGMATAVAVGWVLSLVMPSAFDPEQVGQIMARTSPRLLDLLAALATGLAGAFAIGRKDVSDTLPGVAIAISLVPPLANAGILFSTGRSDLAMGSLLLFATNYLAILLTGALVFGMMGYPRVAFVGHSRRGKRIAIAIALGTLLLISLPLAVQSLTVYAQHAAEATATQATETWLKGSDYRLVSVKTDLRHTVVNVVIAGSGPLPRESGLKSALVGKVFGLDVTVEAAATERLRVTTK